MASLELEITVHSAMELKNVNWPNGGLLPYTKVFLSRVETGRYSDTKSTGTDFSGSTIPVWNKTLVFRIKEYHIPGLAANFRVSHLLPPGPRNPAAKAVVGSASLPLTHLFGSGSSSSSNWLYGQGVDRNVQLFRPSGRPQGILFIKAALVPCPQVVTTNMYDDSFSYFASELYRRGLYNMLKMNNPNSANTDSNTCSCMSCCQRHVAAEAAMRCGTVEEDQGNAVNYMQNMYNPDLANDPDSYLASQQQQRRYDVQNTTNPDSSNDDDDFYLTQQHQWQYGAHNVNNPDSAKNEDDCYCGSRQQQQYDVQNTMNPDSSNDYDFYLVQQQQRQYGADNVNNPDSANGDDDFYLDSQQQQRHDMQNTMNPDSSNNDYDIYLAQHRLWQYGVDNLNNSDSANDENDFHLDSQQQHDVHNTGNLNSANSSNNNNNNNCYGMTCAPAEATMRYNSTLEEAEEDVVRYGQYSTEPEVATTSYSHYQEDEDSKLDVLTGAVADLSLKKKHEEEEEEEEDEEWEEEEEEKEEGVELKEKQKTEESTESSDMDREDYYSADEDSDDYVIV